MKRRSVHSLSRWALVVASMLGTWPAYAHNFDDRYGPFLGSFLHPLSALDHGLAFLAVGLWAGQHRGRIVSRGLAAFLAGLLLGASLPWLLKLPDGSVAHLTTLNILSVIVLGGLIAWGRPMPVVLLVLGGFVGMSHGFENSIDRALELRSILSVAGVVGAGLFAAPIVSAIASRVRTGWPRIILRVLGSWIAAIGLMMLGLHLR